MDLFVDEGGYTTVAVAVTLLVSMSLVLCVATGEWVVARTADIQQVADAAALAGSATVGKFCTVAQVLDASVLSMGLVGLVILGAGMVMASVPGAQGVSAEALDTGADLLHRRTEFARSAANGLQTLERTLPLLVVANSLACTRANARGGFDYAGVAVPFPLESHSDYGSLEPSVDGDGIADASRELQEATRQEEDASRRADEALREAWRADCVDAPSCLRSRAASLAGLPEVQNPHAPDPESWSFGMAILRCRAYYARRLAQESPQADDIESVTDSLARRKFYEYALGEANGAYARQDDEGYVDLYVPHLARNATEMRSTWLYADVSWPCTLEEEGRTLHSTLECPGAMGDEVGFDSVASVDAGTCQRCSICRMDVADLGAVAAISTSATNGYEHYWQIIVEAAERYEGARNEQVQAERQMRRIAQEGSDAFERALEQLRVPRPRICPPGAWGCVSVVARGRGEALDWSAPTLLEPTEDLPAGAAVSAAALAPDDTSDGNSLLAHFFDGVTKSQGLSVGGVMEGVTTLWGRLLVSYGSAFEGVGGSVSRFFDGMDGIFGGSVGAWLQRRLSELVDMVGLQPSDMRARKPVLVNTAQVLDQAGIERSGTLRSMVQALPHHGSATQFCRALGIWVWDERVRTITMAELPIPGSDDGVPLVIDLSVLGEVA